MLYSSNEMVWLGRLTSSDPCGSGSRLPTPTRASVGIRRSPLLDGLPQPHLASCKVGFRSWEVTASGQLVCLLATDTENPRDLCGAHEVMRHGHQSDTDGRQAAPNVIDN